MRRVAAIGAVCLLVPARANAGGEGFLLGGLTLGHSLHDASDDGIILGAEISGGVIHEVNQDASGKGITAWFGAYVDTVRDLGSSTTLSLGPEVGLWYVGLDGGLVQEFGGAGRTGFAIRPALTVGVASVFVRYKWFPGATPEDSFVEVGVLLKYPFAPNLALGP